MSKRTPSSCVSSKTRMREQRPEELFDADGRLVRELKELAPEGTRA